MAPEKFRGFEPLHMILDGFRAARFLRVAEVALVIAHDQQDFDAEIVRAPFEIAEILLIPRMTLEEGIDQFNRVDAKIIFGDFRKIKVVKLATLQRVMQRPFSQRKLEGWLGCRHVSHPALSVRWSRLGIARFSLCRSRRMEEERKDDGCNDRDAQRNKEQTMEIRELILGESLLDQLGTYRVGDQCAYAEK